jgi:hypothetical protein
MRCSNLARQSCLANNAMWRREAQHLRALSLRKWLPNDAAAQLRREADAADTQADWWLTAAIETR